MASLRFFLSAIILVLLSIKVICDPYGLSVSDVTASSVVLHWKTSDIWADAFKVHCTGLIQGYTDPYTDIDLVVQYAPKGVDHVMVGGMKANFIYSCIVIEELSDGEIKLSKPFRFSTKGGDSGESDGLSQPNIPVSHVVYMAHLSMAAGLGMLSALVIMGCTLCVFAVVIIRDKNDLEKESKELERLIVACSSSDQPVHDDQWKYHPCHHHPIPLSESHPILATTPGVIQCPVSKSATSIVYNPANNDPEYKATVYYTAESNSDYSVNDTKDYDIMLAREDSNRVFCTPPDGDDGIDTGGNNQEVLPSFGTLPKHANTPSGLHPTRSLSVFSSSSSSEGRDVDSFLENEHIEIDISSII